MVLLTSVDPLLRTCFLSLNLKIGNIKMTAKGSRSQWRIQDFPEGAANPRGEYQPDLAKILPTTALKWKKLVWEGMCIFGARLDPPLDPSPPNPHQISGSPLKCFQKQLKFPPVAMIMQFDDTKETVKFKVKRKVCVYLRWPSDVPRDAVGQTCPPCCPQRFQVAREALT